MRRYAFALTVFCSFSLAAQSFASECELYQHRDYGGTRVLMENGDSVSMEQTNVPSREARMIPRWNDHVSSLKLARGCAVVTWWDAANGREAGEGRRWSGSYRYIGDRWNDQISYAFCTCG